MKSMGEALIAHYETLSRGLDLQIARFERMGLPCRADQLREWKHDYEIRIKDARENAHLPEYSRPAQYVDIPDHCSFFAV